MLYLKIDPHSGVPVYRQVMDQIRYYVGSETLKPGARLPSIRELSRALAVNPTTVVKAYSELEHAGVIEMKQGKGAFVTDSGVRLSPSQRKEALRRLARQLAVEAAQMDAAGEVVIQVVQEELDRMKTGCRV